MPPDFRTSFSGSALPFASESMAFNPSQRPIRLPAASNLAIPPGVREPNFYYAHGAFTTPRARVRYTAATGGRVTEMVPITGVRRVPGRTLTRVPRASAASSRDAPVVTAETVLRASARPWMLRARA